MCKRRLPSVLAVLAAAAVIAPLARATTVQPLTWSQLVRAADTIAVVHVAGAEAYRGQLGEHTGVLTALTLTTTENLKGRAPASLTVFGGTVGELTNTLVGQPHLKAGDDVLLFLHADYPLSPYVGIWQGVFFVRQGRIWTHDNKPVVDIDGEELVLGGENETPMPLASFAAAIRETLAVHEPTEPLEPSPADPPTLKPRLTDQPAKMGGASHDR